MAPLGVLDEASQVRLKLDMEQVRKHLASLRAMKDLEQRLCKAWEILESGRADQGTLLSTDQDVDGAIYDGFYGDSDRHLLPTVRSADPKSLGELDIQFKDSRLVSLLPLYKARNYSKLLTSEERTAWEKFREHRLMNGGQQSRMAKFAVRLQEIMAREGLTQPQQYILEELRLYAESIMPESE